MSFLKNLLGLGSGAQSSQAKPVAEETHAGYLMRAMPVKEGGQFRLCGVVSRDVGGEMKEHRLIRADTFSSPDDAAQAFFRKAKLVIDQQGDKMFG